jgi:hypothetical protein
MREDKRKKNGVKKRKVDMKITRNCGRKNAGKKSQFVDKPPAVTILDTFSEVWKSP